MNHLHGYFTREHKGDLISRMNSDVFEIEAVAGNSLEVLFKEPLHDDRLFHRPVHHLGETDLVHPAHHTHLAFGIAMVTKKLKKGHPRCNHRSAACSPSSTKPSRVCASSVFQRHRLCIETLQPENDIYRKASLQDSERDAPAFSEVSG